MWRNSVANFQELFCYDDFLGYFLMKFYSNWNLKNVFKEDERVIVRLLKNWNWAKMLKTLSSLHFPLLISTSLKKKKLRIENFLLLNSLEKISNFCLSLKRMKGFLLTPTESYLGVMSIKNPNADNSMEICHWIKTSKSN